MKFLVKFILVKMFVFRKSALLIAKMRNGSYKVYTLDKMESSNYTFTIILDRKS